ncbi:MAG TPA: S41 family peptidase [Luteimonas sp.]|nr:S41 family peptidase [Luteimonas sp.]
MRRILALLLAAWVALWPAHVMADPLTPAQATRELRILERALRDLHPGLYRYQTAAGLEAEFAAARAAVAQSAEPGTLFLLATRISASIRCGHTWTNPLNQGPAMQALLSNLPALPARVRLLQGRLLVTASTDPALPGDTEILAIDGRRVPELVDTLMPYLRADGGSDGKRLSQIDSVEEGGALDRLLPLLHPPVAGRYRLAVRAPDGTEREAVVSAQSVAVREAALRATGRPPQDMAWRFAVEGDTATLTLPTFAFWNDGFDWKTFLQDAFETLAKARTPRLVIDLRQNEGGDDAIGRALVAYLIDRPYRVPAGRVESAYERVPYDLARYLDTWDFGFFDRTGQVRKQAGGNWLLEAQPPAMTVMPGAPRYRGTVIALVGPRMSSAGFLLARDLQASGAATLVGEPTGGNLRGLNGGQLAWLTLPYSGVAVDIPLLATVHAGAPDAGIQPDVLVETTVEDVLARRDPALETAVRLGR